MAKKYTKITHKDICMLMGGEERIIDTVLSYAPFLSYSESLKAMGPEGFASIYDLANIKKDFHKEGKKIPSRKPRDNFFWTGEFIGYAPKGHPAEGKLIMAKVVDTAKEPYPEESNLKREKEIMVLDKEYAPCEDLIREDGGYILGFEERNGLMVPVTDGVTTAHCYDPGRDIKGYGTLKLIDGWLSPIAYRSASWNPSGTFTNANGMDAKFKVIRKESLKGLLE